MNLCTFNCSYTYCRFDILLCCERFPHRYSSFSVFCKIETHERLLNQMDDCLKSCHPSALPEKVKTCVLVTSV